MIMILLLMLLKLLLLMLHQKEADLHLQNPSLAFSQSQSLFLSLFQACALPANVRYMFDADDDHEYTLDPICHTVMDCF